MTQEEVKKALFRRELLSTLQEVDPICLTVRTLLKDHGLNDVAFYVELLAHEFMNNAIIHGNKQNTDKKVIFEIKIGRKWILIQISDEGAGFDWRHKKKSLELSSTATSGRGLAIAAAYADRMVYNRIGNSVRIWINKRKKGGQYGGVRH